MTKPLFLQRFRARGVFWRHLLAWAVNNVSYALEPMQMWVCTFFFFVIWGPGRRAVFDNLQKIRPHASWLRNYVGTYQVFLNFAWTFTDSAQFLERQINFDWEFEGEETLQAPESADEGGIILTAHMGNYDLGSFIFARKLNRAITTIRAPEVDPESQAYSASQLERLGGRFKVMYNTDPPSLAYQLVEAIGRGEVVAIQGDRALPGVPSREAKLFGVNTRFPIGPFALAMATKKPIHPRFIARVGRRRYRVIASEPIWCERKAGVSKDEAIAEAMKQWNETLEKVIGEHWPQWFAFERFGDEEKAHA